MNYILIAECGSGTFRLDEKKPTSNRAPLNLHHERPYSKSKQKVMHFEDISVASAVPCWPRKLDSQPPQLSR
jgi:hypothetical protein